MIAKCDISFERASDKTIVKKKQEIHELHNLRRTFTSNHLNKS